MSEDEDKLLFIVEEKINKWKKKKIKIFHWMKTNKKLFRDNENVLAL